MDKREKKVRAKKRKACEKWTNMHRMYIGNFYKVLTFL